MSPKRHIATIAAAALALPASGLAQDDPPRGAAPDRAAGAPAAEVPVLERHDQRHQRTLELTALEARYAKLFAEARELGVEPRDDLREHRVLTEAELDEGVAELRDRVAAAREPEPAPAPTGAVAGVSQATLDAIAACESGGDPTAVNPAGYYGKYQFDLGTWQSVGGTGNPAEAPEAEQDYRAALLYSQAGASPWPVCGA